MLKRKEPTVQDRMMWNGVDLEMYAKSFRPECIITVHQFLQLFQWDKNAEKILDYLINVKWKAGQRVKAERVQRAKKARVFRDEPGELNTIVGVCPRCGDMLLGEPIRGCENKSSGRLFYKECISCPYYYELFEKDLVLIESEGD